MPNLDYDVALVTEAVRLIALHPQTITISYRLIHKVTRLPYDAPEVEDAEERIRKKGKYKVEEDIPRHSSEHPSQPSTEQGATIGAHQVPIPPLSEYLTSRIQLEWPETIPDNFINLAYEDRWKIFEEGLDKKECELFNHEQWRPTFMANDINILVRDLVRKIKDLEQGESSETKKAKDQPFATEQKIQFIQKFYDVWLSDITPNESAYQQLQRNYSSKILEGLESLITKWAPRFSNAIEGKKKFMS
eukprot:Gb_39821 [translate_table: standard]